MLSETSVCSLPAAPIGHFSESLSFVLDSLNVQKEQKCVKSAKMAFSNELRSALKGTMACTGIAKPGKKEKWWSFVTRMWDALSVDEQESRKEKQQSLVKLHFPRRPRRCY